MLSSSQRNPSWPDHQIHGLAAAEFRRIWTLLPADILLLAAPVNNWMASLDRAEKEIVKHAVSGRQAEFSTGRMLAARALREIGMPVGAILCGPMNEPLWPEGMVGSVTHTADICMVAVATTSDIVGLGIDIVGCRAEFDHLEHLILRLDERCGAGGSSLSDNEFVGLVFGAKESLYKAIYPHAKRFIDFQEVRIEVCAGTGQFSASAPDDEELHALVRHGIGRYLFTEELLFTAWYQH